MFVDGVEIMNFALNEVAELIEKFLSDNGLSKDDINLYACHQANKRILSALADKLNVPREKIPFVADETGNTSSSSIPFVGSTKFSAAASESAWRSGSRSSIAQIQNSAE